jgi:hypothetical protein
MASCVIGLGAAASVLSDADAADATWLSASAASFDAAASAASVVGSGIPSFTVDGARSLFCFGIWVSSVQAHPSANTIQSSSSNWLIIKNLYFSYKTYFFTGFRVFPKTQY